MCRILNQSQRLGTTISNTITCRCIISHRDNQPTGIMIQISINPSRMDYTITHTIIIKLTTIALINHQHQFTIRARIHRCTMVALSTTTTTIHKIHQQIHMSPPRNSKCPIHKWIISIRIIIKTITIQCKMNKRKFISFLFSVSKSIKLIKETKIKQCITLSSRDHFG